MCRQFDFLNVLSLRMEMKRVSFVALAVVTLLAFVASSI
jgi:hypothetical protein